jgi:D-serine deaminase-like pyridoxal phosphate-dependent protein
MTTIHDLSTPALLIDADVLETNLATMAARRPAATLRPHVKAHKCTSLARRQVAHGHHTFTCATVREVLGMAAAGLGADLLLANEVVDPHRLGALAAAQGDDTMITVAVDSSETVEAAARAGLRHVLVDVDIGLPRCGCSPDEAGRLADEARRRGLIVRGVMGYEGHLMALERPEQRDRVEAALEVLLAVHEAVGGDEGVPVVSTGGTGTHDLHPLEDDHGHPVEVQAGSYALMDTHYARFGHPFGYACTVLGTVVSARPGHLVADVGLKALGMDHGDPSIEGATVWFCSDEHVTFAIDADHPRWHTRPVVGERVRVLPAHIDPTMAMHDTAWVVRGDDVVDRWDIDLRGW